MRRIKLHPGVVGLCLLAGLACAQHSGHVEPIEFSFDDLYRQSAPSWWTGFDDPPPASAERGDSQAGHTIVLGGYGMLGQADRRADADLFEQSASLLEQLGLSVGRTTALRDGGIDGTSASIRRDALAGFAEQSGEFDLYDISIPVGTLGSRELGLTFLTGFRAIRADVSRVSVSRDRSGNTITTLREGMGVVAVPVVGTGVHWNPNDALQITGGASTHTISDATYFDLRAQAEIRLRHNVGLTAGYEFVHSAMQVRDVDAELTEAGLFARIQIKF